MTITEPVSPVGRDKASWADLQQLAMFVFWGIPADSPVQLTVTEGSDREVRSLIYAVLFDVSEGQHNDGRLKQSTSMVNAPMTVAELTTKIDFESDTKKHLTLLALAMQENSGFFHEQIRKSAEHSRKKTKKLETRILSHIGEYLYNKWKTLGPQDHEAREMLAKFSIKVMSGSFLPKGGAFAARGPVIRLDDKPTMAQLRSLQVGKVTMSVIEQTSSDYGYISVFLLNDNGQLLGMMTEKAMAQGAVIIHEEAMEEVYKSWLAGGGGDNITWRKLLELFKDIKRSHDEMAPGRSAPEDEWKRYWDDVAKYKRMEKIILHITKAAQSR